MNIPSPELDRFLSKTAASARHSLIGLVAAATLATVVVGGAWLYWVKVGQVAAHFERTVRQQGEKRKEGPDVYGLDLARYMLEMRTHLVALAGAVALGGYAVSLLFLFDLSFKLRLRRLLASTGMTTDQHPAG